MGAKWNRIRIEIPKGINPENRELLASEIIEHIRDLASQGRGYTQATGRVRKFPKYSKDYAEWKGQTNVDLALSNEMLEDIKLLSHRSGSLLIGFEKGTESNAKADGNQTGSYGRPSGDASKARPFLGITKADMSRIIERVALEREEDG